MVLLTETGRPPTNIKVCDALMGSGKTSAAIQYMNQHPGRKFIYVSPRIEEDRRIVAACPMLYFALPSDKGRDRTKTVNLKRLLQAGRNVAISHVLYTLCDDEVCALMRQHGYSMIIDEAVHIFEDAKVTRRDIETMMGSGAVRVTDNGYLEFSDGYDPDGHSEHFRRMWHLAASHKLVLLPNGQCCYWMVSDRMLLAAQEVIIMTYRFSASDMARLMQIHHIPYAPIYVDTDGRGNYWFTDRVAYVPAYAGHMRDMVRIVDDQKLNAIGEKWNALSKGWWDTNMEAYRRSLAYGDDGSMRETAASKATDAYRMRSLLRKYMRTDHPDTSADDRLFGCFAKPGEFLKQKGYLNAHLVFNATSLNEWGNRHVLAYLVNVFQRPEVDQYYQSLGFEGKRDEYALTTMLQWIWRSAIRNGEPVELYLPSRRMREILAAWINECEEDYKRLYHISEEDTE